MDLGNKNYERTTACIKNSGFNTKSNIGAFNKSQCQTAT